jgi:TolA-binding protein
VIRSRIALGSFLREALRGEILELCKEVVMIKTLGALVAMARGELPTWAMVAEWRAVSMTMVAERDREKGAHDAEVQRLTQRISELETMVKQASAELERVKVVGTIDELEKYHAAYLRGKDQGKAEAFAAQTKATADVAKGVTISVHGNPECVASQVKNEIATAFDTLSPEELADQARSRLAANRQACADCVGCKHRCSSEEKAEVTLPRIDDAPLGTSCSPGDCFDGAYGY